MTIKERLVKFAKSKERSVRAFEREAGLTIGYVNTIRVSVQPDKLQRIASRYPDLNTEWLMTGVGRRLCDDLDGDRRGRNAECIYSSAVASRSARWDTQRLCCVN